MRLIAALGGLLLTTGVLAATPAAAAEPEPTAQQIRFTTSDGVSLQTTLFSSDPSVPRPTVVEFSPYGNNSQTVTPSPGTNVLLVQIRGTGSSDGRFDALGPRNQADVPEVLQWACEQPWSNGSLGINGFSASAIIIYNSMHQQLPCVKAMVLKSGTFELYRDLLVPGGVSNIVPGDVLAGQHVLAVAVGQQHLHARVVLDAVVDAAQVVIEPGVRLGRTAVRALRRAVVGPDDEQVGAVVAQLLVALERAA
jgi:putative CocE/NonD family hydrolase